MVFLCQNLLNLTANKILREINQNLLERSVLHSVQIHDVSIPRNLCEINFGDSGFLKNSETLNFDSYKFVQILKAEIYQISTMESIATVDFT